MEKQVLIIEDDEGMRKQLKRVFEVYEDEKLKFKVTTAKDVKEAEECLKRKGFDVAIIDMKLPESPTSGVEIVTKSMEDFRLHSPMILPIIYTAYPSYETCVNAMRSGAWDYIDKNSVDSMNKLLQSVKEGLERRYSSETGPDTSWLETHLPEFKKKYGDRFIALIGEEVVASGVIIDNLKEEMKEKYPDKKPYYLWIPQG